MYLYAETIASSLYVFHNVFSSHPTFQGEDGFPGFKGDMGLKGDRVNKQHSAFLASSPC